MLALASLIMNLYKKKYLGWPMLAMSRGNIGHPMFFCNGTSGTNTMVYGIGIEGTIIGTNFYVKIKI